MCTFVLVVSIVLSCRAAAAQTTADLFDRRTLHTLHLRINATDLELLHERYLENTFYPVQLEWQGIQVRTAGVRSRGTGSRNATKPGLQIEFGRYLTGQQFLGLDTLVLDNVWQDATFIRESVTMALFERMGQAAPRESFARVYINDEYAGLYAIVEAIDQAFLTRAFGRTDGYVFEYHWLKAFYGEYPGSDLAAYAAMFEARTHVNDSDTSLYDPVEELFRRINAPVDTLWLSTVSGVLDVRQVLTHLAIEQFVSELDGIAGYDGMNNFYLYRPEGSQAHQFIPWDRDNAFQDRGSSVVQRIDEYPLLGTLLSDPDLRAYYLDALNRVARTAAAEGWLRNEIISRAALIRDEVRDDGFKNFSYEQFESEISTLQRFATVRPGIVRSQVQELQNAQ